MTENQSGQGQEQQGPDVHVDEGWKQSVAEEREKLREKVARAREQRQQGGEASSMGEPTIESLMAGLYTQTLVAMGQVPNPVSGEKEENLPEAEYLIDTIAMLRQKTEGNLTGEESGYIESILYDLRMRYVTAASSKKETEKGAGPE